MEEKINILLKKIGLDEESYQYFSDARLTKIKINTKNSSWSIFIEKETLLPVKIFEELETKKMLLDEKA